MTYLMKIYISMQQYVDGVAKMGKEFDWCQMLKFYINLHNN
jgi:hypothetical protein